MMSWSTRIWPPVREEAMRSALDVEGHALGQRQGGGVFDGVGGAAHVGLPAVGAGLAPAAGLLLAAEGAADLSAARTDVDVGDAAVRARARDEALGLAHVQGEDGGRQAGADFVVPVNRVVERLVAQH